MTDETRAIYSDRTARARYCLTAPARQAGSLGAMTTYPETGAGGPAGLPRELGKPKADRKDDVTRRARAGAVDEIAWRRALHAVKLCQQVAELSARRRIPAP